MGAGPAQLDVYSRLTLVREAAEAEGAEATAAVKDILSMLERRTSRRRPTSAT